MHKQSLLQKFFLDTWYNQRWWAWLLWPLSYLYNVLFLLNAYWQRKHAVKVAVPVIVIGNISVGGTGKTPMIIALACALQRKGVKVGIISRGYGSHAPYYPYRVRTGDTASIVGDEPLFIATSVHCPVVIGADRVKAVDYLLEIFPETQLVLSDDGLQHYRLMRDMEVAVIDSVRGLGNHLCLPAGPLREPAGRLASVDWVVLNSHGEPLLHNVDDADKAIRVSLQPVAWRQLSTQRLRPLQPLPWGQETMHVKAIAGIGHPQRFFNTIKSLDIRSDNYAFDDHHVFSEQEFSHWRNDIVLMTEKDAVKCQAFAHKQCWSLVVDMPLPEYFVDSVAGLIQQP